MIKSLDFIVGVILNPGQERPLPCSLLFRVISRLHEPCYSLKDEKYIGSKIEAPSTPLPASPGISGMWDTRFFPLSVHFPEGVHTDRLLNLVSKDDSFQGVWTKLGHKNWNIWSYAQVASGFLRQSNGGEKSDRIWLSIFVPEGCLDLRDHTWYRSLKNHKFQIQTFMMPYCQAREATYFI